MNRLTHEQAHSWQVQLTPRGVLDGLESQQVGDLEKMGVYMDYNRELVVADGHSHDYFFYIVKGSFEVSKVNPETKARTMLASINEGQCFGEMSFLTKAPASANVTAEGEVIAWAIPHASLRQFIEMHPGGVRLGLNIATLLAHRIQEGNTRLMGLGSTLSAYFGYAARTSDQKVLQPPQTGDSTEMEIPDEVFDEFVRHSLGLERGAGLVDEQRETVRARIASNELDIVPWLETGRGRKLTVRLKFMHELPAPRQPRPPSPAKPIAGTHPQPVVVKVPQARARIAPEIAYLDRKPNPAWKWLNVASFAVVPILVVWVIFILMPLEARESMTESSGFKSLPMQGLLRWFVYRSQERSIPITLGKGASYPVPMQLQQTARLNGRIEFASQKQEAVTLGVRLGLKDSSGPPVVSQMVNVSLMKEATDLFSARIPAGYYVLEITCEQASEGLKMPAVLHLDIRR